MKLPIRWKRTLHRSRSLFRRVRKVAFGAGDPQLTPNEQKRLLPLKAEEDRQFDEFDELMKDADDEEAQHIVSEFFSRNASLFRQIFVIEVAPWVRAANELDVKVPVLFDTTTEPSEHDPQAFGKLKRAVRKANRREHREALSYAGVWIGILLGVLGFFLSGLGLYTEHVYKREHLGVQFLEVNIWRAAAGIVVVKGTFVNNGDRPLLVHEPRIVLESPTTTIVRKYAALSDGLTYPLQVMPRDVVQFSVSDNGYDLAPLQTQSVPLAVYIDFQVSGLGALHVSPRLLVANFPREKIVPELYANEDAYTVKLLAPTLDLVDNRYWLGAFLDWHTNALN